MAGSIAPVNIDLRVRTGEVAKGIADVKSRVNDLDRSVQRIGRGAGSPAYAGAFQSIRRDAQATTRAVNETKAATSGLLKMAVKGLVAGATLGVGVLVTDLVGNLSGGLSTAVKESVMLAAEAEKSALAFEVMLGSAEAAGRMLAQLRAYSAESPFNSKDVQDAAKQLIAFGFDADQALPTIRALGDVASGVGVPLGQLVNAYGQVATAGRLMGTELLQFTQAGVPIIDALATVLKKPKEDIKALVEQGRVGFPVVVRAFKLMTEEGGKFAGMGDRYGKSMAGLFEQLQDAAELAQTEFGRVVIEETGLKDATRDLTAFTGRIRDMANELRPAVRFAGDLVKAAVQLSHEGVRIAGIFARTGADTLVAAAPQLKDAVTSIQSTLKDLQEFRINPRKVAEVGLFLSKVLLSGIASWSVALNELGLTAKEHFVDPFLAAAEAVKHAADQIYEVIAAANRLRAEVNGQVWVDPRKSIKQTKADDPFKDWDKGIQGVHYWRMAELERIEQRIFRADGRRMPFAAGAEAEWKRTLEKFRAEDITAGRVPMFPADAFPRDPRLDAPFTDEMRAGYAKNTSWAERFRVGMLSINQKLFDEILGPNGWVVKYEAQQKSDLKDREAKAFASAQENIYVGGAAFVGGAFDHLGQSARQAAAELQALKVPTTVDPSITDAAKRANDLASQLDPVGDLRRQIYGTRFAFQNGLIQNPELRDRAMAEVFRKATAGIDWQFRLPSAAEYGTTDFARAQALAAGGVVGDSAAAKLQALVEYTQQERDEIKKLAEELRHLFPLLALPARLGP